MRLMAGPQVDRGALLAVRHRPPPPPPLLTVQPLPPPAPTEEDQRHLQSGRGRYQQVIPRSSPSASPAEDQPFTERERVTFRLVLASECRFLRGLDIAWVQPATGDAPSASQMIPGALRVAG